MKLRTLCGIALFAYASSPLLAQEPRVYSEGAVSVVTTVNVHDGQLESYMGYLSKTFKPDMEAQKKAGNVLAYAVYTTRARTPDDPDLYLVVTYTNMAAFDGIDDREEAVSQKVSGESGAQADLSFIARGKMREIMGSEVIREVVLK